MHTWDLLDGIYVCTCTITLSIWFGEQHSCLERFCVCVCRPKNACADSPTCGIESSSFMAESVTKQMRWCINESMSVKKINEKLLIHHNQQKSVFVLGWQLKISLMELLSFNLPLQWPNYLVLGSPLHPECLCAIYQHCKVTNFELEFFNMAS